MTEQEYKQTLNLIENSVFADMPLQWVESFQPGIGQIIANIEREVVEWADLNKPIWDSDPAQSGTYNAVKNELLAFAQNLQKYKDDPARSEVIYDFINAARSLYSFNKNYGLDTTPLTNAANPFKLSVVSSRVTSFGYMHFKSLSNLVKFNEDLLASIDDEKIQLKGYTKTVLEPVREKLYKLITEDPEFKNLLDELGFGEVDDFIQSFAPNTEALESLTDEFFSNFNTFVGDISARLDAERETTDLAIADARADAQESIDEALARVDTLVADLSTYQTGVNTQIQTIQSAYESLNNTVQSNISRIGATEAAIIQEAATRADGFVATASQINAIVSRIDDVDASIIQEANTRASEDAATVDRIDQLVTRVDDNAAAIVNEQNARTTALLAEAAARETLAAQLKTDGELYASGLVTSEANVRASQDEILGERIDLVSAEVGGISTAILNEQTARITGDEAEATSRKALSTKLFGTDVIDGITVDTLTSGFLYDQQQSIITQTESAVTNVTGQIAQIQTDLTNTKADLLTETTTRVNEYGAIATSVTALSTEVNNQKATLDSLNSIVSGPDGITTQWGIKSDINGYITGVGLISSSKYGTPTSQFIVYADQFALVTPGVNGGQPTIPFFVGSEQGYLELSNTVKSNWNNVIGDGKPQDGATVGADWNSNVANRPDPTSFLESFQSGNLAQWTNHSGSGELSIVSVSDSLTGGKVLRIGNNSGNDQAWLIHNQNIPFDPSALYRIKFRVRRTAGTGVVYLGVAGVAADGVTWVSTSGANSTSSQHYVAASRQNPGSTWTEYVGYVKGTAATGQTGTNPPVTAPLKLHQNVRFIRPLIIANYSGVAGITEVDYCSIELMTDAVGWDDVSGVGKDNLVTTASTALTNANNAQTAANTANAALADIAADNKLTPVEKQSAANEWGIINRERASIQAQASALGISTELGDYNYTYAVLNDYITPLLSDLQSTSAIDGVTFRDKWSYFYEYRQRLINKMAAVAATKADWASVTGSGKPENGATVGADWNSNLFNRPSNSQLLNNLLDTSTWSGPSHGGAAGFNPNGSDYEQWRRTRELPDGSQGISWFCYPGLYYNNAYGWDNPQPNASPAGDADGGWNSDAFPITSSKGYRFSVWVCHTGGNTGAAYLGCGAGSVRDMGGGAVNNNPYFVVSGISGLVDNRWYLFVGYVHPENRGTEGQTSLSGIYDGTTGAKVATGTDYCWAPGATTSIHRAYLYYSAAGSHIDFVWPRVDMLNGMEPSLAQLLAPAIAARAESAKVSADAANAALADIAADNKLTAVEKQSAANEWGIINRERASIRTQADALGISHELWDYDYVYAVLNDYITPLLQDISSTSVIDGATFRDKWSFFYEYRQRLLNKMAAVAATKADWASVSGSGKPADGATSGANLVKKSHFRDGLAGGWGGTVSVNGAANSGRGEIASYARDAYEYGNEFAVVGNEKLFVAYDAYTALTAHETRFGLQFLDAVGGIIGWLGVPTAAGQDWHHVKGEITVPTGAVTARPWLQISASDNFGASVWNALYVGRVEESATVGANASNLKVGVGVNMVFNGDYTDGLAGTTVGWRSAGNQHTLSRNLSNYIVQGEGTAYIQQPGWNGTSEFLAYVWNGQEGQYFAVTPGQRYEVYAYLNTHRCVGSVGVLFLDTAGNQIGSASGNEVSYENSINTISDMRMSHCFVVAPWNAAKALVIIRGYGINSYDPYVFFSRVYFGMAHAGQTEASPWSPGRGISQITSSNVTTYIENAAIGAAQIGSINLVGTSNFAVKTAASGARMDMDSRRIKVYDASGTLRVQLGDLTA